MNAKQFIFLFSLISVFLIGCSRQPSGEADLAALRNDAPLASITPVASLPLPSELQQIPPELYAYDDLSQRTRIEFLGEFYGVPNSNPDPVAQYLGNKYNADITWTSVSPVDMESIISTRFAVGDEPDVLVINTGLRQVMQLLYDQGLVADAEIAMRYMPNYARYFTEDDANFIKYKGVYPAAPRYPFQVVYDNFIRRDWLEILGMDMPTTLDELLTYARRVTREDPDGNGRNDTWFGGGAGGGMNLGMFWGLLHYFGDSNFNEKDGKINHPYLDGTYKNFLTFIKQLYDEGLLIPDWYTIDWESFKSYSLNGRVGFVNYPAINLLVETMVAMGLDNRPDETGWDMWTPVSPLGTGKAQPIPGPSYMFVFPAKTLKDPVKFKRICHILDQSLFGGSDYLETIQGGGNEVFGREVFIFQHNDNGSISFTANRRTHPAWTGELDTTGLANAGWQTIGLVTPPYNLHFEPDNPYFNERLAELSAEQAAFERWPNNFIVNINIDVLASISQFSLVEEPKFILGGRDLAQWDDYVTEWLNRGGRAALAEAAAQMNLADFE